MKEMICIVCPRGCHLQVSSSPDYVVTGNACPRGVVYGREEMVDPKRVVTTSCPLVVDKTLSSLSMPHRIPVRTTSGIPKAMVQELVAELSKKEIALPVKEGQVIIEDWRGTTVSVIATRSFSISVLNSNNT